MNHSTLPSRSTVIWVLIVALIFSGSVWVVFEADRHEWDAETVRAVNEINHSAGVKYRVYLDKYYREACVVNRLDTVDPVLFHSIHERLVKADSHSIMLNILDKDSIHLYTEYSMFLESDTNFYVVDHYEY